MANRIKGITIEIGGDTTGLDKALKGVNSSISKTQSALNDVNRLLKLDPTNTVLVTQKQELLSQAISQTEEKLSALEAAQEQVAAAFQRGDLGEDKYQAFQREIEETRGKLTQYQNDLTDLQTEQDRLGTNTQRLEKLFQATGTTVDDYADVLGDQLVRAIKNGRASSDQLKTAIEKIGSAATGGRADVRQLIDAIDTVDDGTAITNLIQQLREASNAADKTSESIGGIADATKGSALIQAADQLSGVGDKLQELGNAAVDAFSDAERASSKVSAYFGETGEAAERSAAIIENVYGNGVGDSMESVADALILVKRNLGDLNDTDLTNLTQQALRLDELYGIDMNETLRGVNSLMVQFGLTARRPWTISWSAPRMAWTRQTSWVTTSVSMRASSPKRDILLLNTSSCWTTAFPTVRITWIKSMMPSMRSRPDWWMVPLARPSVPSQLGHRISLQRGRMARQHKSRLLTP